MATRILLAARHQLVRDALAAALETERSFEITANCGDGIDVLDQLQRTEFDVAVVESQLPGMNGIELTRRIAESFTRVSTVGVSESGDREEVLGFIEAGANACLTGDSSLESLVTAIRKADNQERFLTSVTTNALVESYVHRDYPNDESLTSVLGDREREVLQLLAEGKTSKEIGRMLHISASTVDAHRRNLMKKLDLHSVAELTKFAIRHGLTPLDS